jgi:DNA-binding NarL/FixJ family response regulator
MDTPINVLIAEDELIIIDLLKNIFKHLSEPNKDWSFKLHTVSTCDHALKKIHQAKLEHPFDLALLDVNLPPSKEKSIMCGEDLGLLLRKHFPKIKVMVYTSSNDNYRLNNILRSVNPEGFLIKSDVGYKGLVKAIERILTGQLYYSSSILKLIRQHISSDFVLDATDRIILYQISKGTKTKDLPRYVNLSKGGVERRKRHLKEIFDIEDNGKCDKKLIQIAKERGYV